jgi:hypothetical protein
MRFAITGLIAISASTVSAVALAPTSGPEHVEFFKRDQVLDARDLELAESHGVNLTESKFQ